MELSKVNVNWPSKGYSPVSFEKTNLEFRRRQASRKPLRLKSPIPIRSTFTILHRHCAGSVGCCFYFFLLALIQSLDRTSRNPKRLVLPLQPLPLQGSTLHRQIRMSRSELRPTYRN
uniref:Uncharacterized protein n=1 Tax=Stipa capillata TaxID=665498 RepID=A0A8F5VB24_9POAL|nr:hypothetical protein [Stipa capillata]